MSITQYNQKKTFHRTLVLLSSSWPPPSFGGAAFLTLLWVVLTLPSFFGKVLFLPFLLWECAALPPSFLKAAFLFLLGALDLSLRFSCLPILFSCLCFFFVFTFFQWFLFFSKKIFKNKIIVNFCCLPLFNFYYGFMFSFFHFHFSSRFYYYHQYFHVSFHVSFSLHFFWKKEKGGGSTRDVFTRKVALSGISPPGHSSTHASKKTKVP